MILSCYDPLRREIAKLTIERLMQDGRIHPARIEEIAEKVKKDLDITMKEEGEKAAFDLGIHNIHPEIIKLLGRLKYRTSYGQNVLMHSREVAYFAGIMAAECGVDQKLARRAGLLHDLGKAIDHEVEGTHPQLGGDLAKKYGENRQGDQRDHDPPRRRRTELRGVRARGSCGCALGRKARRAARDARELPQAA